MDAGARAILLVIEEFASGGSVPQDEVVRFGIAALSWASLMLLAWLSSRDGDSRRDRWLISAFAVGFAREAVMFLVYAAVVVENVQVSVLRPFLPPLEYALNLFAILAVGGAFLGYLERDWDHALRVMGISHGATGLLYLVTALAWPRILARAPLTLFEATWCAWAWSIAGCALIGWTIALMVMAHERRHLMLVSVLTMFFAEQAVALANLATGTTHSVFFGTLGNSLHLLAIPLLGFVYFAEEFARRRDTQVALKRTADHLDRALRETVRAMGRIVEARDRYTGFHNQRTAALADAIALDLNFDEQQRNLISLSCSLHDIGNIGIPGDVLNKPAGLSDIEQALVRSHVEIGVGILRDIDFGAPVREVISQHHERLDGSGYPLGLRGAEIMPEARVLAVADVTSAMLSHRPHRGARTLSETRAELDAGSGTLYEERVVQSCKRALEGGLARLEGFENDGAVDRVPRSSPQAERSAHRRVAPAPTGWTGLT